MATTQLEKGMAALCLAWTKDLQDELQLLQAKRDARNLDPQGVIKLTAFTAASCSLKTPAHFIGVLQMVREATKNYVVTPEQIEEGLNEIWIELFKVQCAQTITMPWDDARHGRKLRALEQLSTTHLPDLAKLQALEMWQSGSFERGLRPVHLMHKISELVHRHHVDACELVGEVWPDLLSMQIDD